MWPRKLQICQSKMRHLYRRSTPNIVRIGCYHLQHGGLQPPRDIVSARPPPGSSFSYSNNRCSTQALITNGRQSCESSFAGHCSSPKWLHHDKFLITRGSILEAQWTSSREITRPLSLHGLSLCYRDDGSHEHFPPQRTTSLTWSRPCYAQRRRS